MGALLICACSDLPSVRQGACGNGALDPGEDCDFFEGIGVPADLACGAPADRDTACHWLCGESASCPAAWGCGQDGVCRYADGQFDDARAIGATRYASVQVGDVDGDGWPDLAGSSGRREVEILYGGPSGFSGVDRLPSSAAGALDGADLDQDGALDVVTTFGGGILLGLGDADRTVSTVLFPTLQLTAPPKRLFALALGGVGETVVIEDAGVGVDVSLVGAAGAGAAHLPLAFAQLVVPPAIADVDGDGDDDLIVTAVGTPDVYLLRTQATVAPPFAVTALAVDSSLTGPRDPAPSHRRSLHLADVDGDGVRDLVAELVGPGGTAGPALARGLGGGAFELLEPDPRFASAAPRCPTDADVPPMAEVLEVADLDGDGLADYLLRDGVYQARTDGTPHLCQVLRAADAGGWSDAVVADLNRDGDADVVAASAGETVDVLLGDGTGVFSQRTISVGTPAQFLRAGDFDGDRVDDVAFVAADAVSILFGTLQGTPEALGMGAVGAVSSFEPLRIPDATGELDAVSDLLVQWPAEGGIELVGYLFGTTSRRMIAPLPVAELVQATLAGSFDADSTTDVIAVGGDVDEAPALRLFRGDGAGGLALVAAGIPDCAELGLAGQTILGRGDLVATAEDEIVSLTREAGQAPPIHIVAPATSDGVLTFTCTEVVPPTASTFEAFQVSDLDGDGVNDLLTVVSGPGGRALVALWNEGNRSFSASEAIPIPAPLAGAVVTSIQVDLDAARELVFVGDDRGLYLVQADGRVLEPPAGVQEIPGELAWLKAADVDGDGLEDLVGGGVGGTVVLSAVAHIGRGLPP